ncbi:MAG TPA: formyltetrahydrofolate deformylase [Acidimicrobiia bacterium]|nr:formyltetrahydrofolate deformylase [Acidimicrobiia bacterium]
METGTERGVLLLSCPDQPGIVAAVATFIADQGGNIVHAEQHTDFDDGVFFQRVEFELDGLAERADELQQAFQPVAARFGMEVTARLSGETARVAVLVSREAHCLQDLLYRWRSGELQADIPVVISNHPDHAELVEFQGSKYVHLPVTPETKPEQERAIRSVLEEHRIDLVVLARYMQILSREFVEDHRNRIINIHHSFLPAFAGARPYHQASKRGVKIIGATAHYVTEELDAGPIIEQDVARVTHRDHADAMVRLGRDIERTVLARAVKWHLEDRVLVHGNRTVVF